MAIDFRHNATPTMGIEMELHIVDKETGDLAQAAVDVIGELAAPHGGEHPKIKHELFQSTVEVITGICNTPAEAHADLTESIEELKAACAERGLALISSGTHPFARARNQQISPDERYHRLVERMQWPARRMLICGMHVHVGVTDGEKSIHIINESLRYLPVMLALSASSPFFEAEDTGMASARSKVFEGLPTAGLPPRIDDWQDFENFMATLLATDSIDSIRSVWWDIRPHPDFGTIEYRMCDAMSTVREATALGGLIQALVVWCDRQLDGPGLPPPPKEWTIRQNRWNAARYGMDANLIGHDEGGKARTKPARQVLEELVEMLWPIAEEIGSTQALEDVLEITTNGSGAERQRRIVAEGGSLADVVTHLRHEFAQDDPTAE